MAIRILSSENITGNLTLSGNQTTGGDLYVTGTSNSLVVISRDNMYVDAGQLYIGADDSTTDDTFRQRVTSGSYFIESRKSGTWTNRLQINTAGTLIVQQGMAISGNIDGVGASFIGTAASGAALVTIENNSGSTATSYGLLVIGGGHSSNGRTFEVRDASGNSDLIVKGNGYVGIGTDSPSAPLTVHGQQKWYTTNNDGNELRGFFNPGGSGDPAELSLYQANGTSVGVELRAFGNSYFNGGNVGIGTGTTSPSNSLHILGTSDQQLKIDVASGGTFSSINFAEAGSNKAAIAYKHSTNEIQLPYSGNASSFVTMMAGGSERIRITSDGRVEVTGSVLSIDTVDEYRQDFITTGASTPSFDIDLKNIGASGQPFEVFVAFTHYSTAYGAGLHQAYYQRSTVQSDITLIHTYFNQTSTNAGAWSVVWLSGTAIRVQKSAGTHLSQGYGYIRVTRLKP
jgi:hypothetical protein